MNFTVYNSSAGSGKTFTLVTEYLSLALSDNGKFRQILAITFTNKAAQEMKHRVLLALKEIAELNKFPSSGSVKYLLPILEKNTGLDHNEIQQRAERLLSQILHSYDDFAVSTIDSFVHRVIKSFSFDLKIPMNFEVELDTDSLLRKSIDILISKVGSEDKLTSFLVNYIKSQTEEDKSWNIENDLLSASKMLMLEDGQIHIENLKSLSLSDFSEIIQKTHSLVREFEHKITDQAKAAWALILSENIPIDSFYQGKQGIGTYFKNLANGLLNKTEPNSYVEKTVSQDKWFAGKIDQVDQASISKNKDKLLQYFITIQDIAKDGFAKYISYNEILKNLYPLAILNEIEKVIAEYKAENDILLIAEFNKRIASIVLNESVPFIYERIGEKFKHYLIDEFQDTSILQWQNFLPLIENSLSEGYFNLIVGDGKQAIYRWRNGEVEQFIALPQIYKNNGSISQQQQEAALARNYKAKVLSYNFRSKNQIIDFNNSFFDFAKQKLSIPHQKIYQDSIQKSISSFKDGFIQIDFHDNKSSSQTFSEFNLENIKRTILSLFDEGFQPKDVAILCRSNHHASQIAQHLLSNKIEVLSSESLLISSSPEVRLLVAMIQLIINPDDQISKTLVCNWLEDNGKSNKQLNDHLLNSGTVQIFNKADRDCHPDFFSYLHDIGYPVHISSILSKSLYETVEDLARTFDLLSTPNAYLLFFLDAVQQQTGTGKANIHNFLEWWDSKKAKLSIIVPEGVNAVKIMTIHKSKGLEFPVVIYPFANEKPGNSKDTLWADISALSLNDLKSGILNKSSQLEKSVFNHIYEEETSKSYLDLINILYVVLTRASDRIYIQTQTPAPNSKTNLSVPILFKGYLKEKGLWQEGQSTYQFGTKTLIDSPVEGQLESNYQLDQIISESWKGKVLLSLQAPRYWDIDDPDKDSNWGTLLHSILAEIYLYEDINHVLTKYYNSGIISAMERETLGKKLTGFMSLDTVKPYFLENITSINEPELIAPDGNVYRPDRIVIKENMISVIDYKTGKYSPNHENQVKQYMNLIKKMKSIDVEGILIYINDTKPVKYVSL
ncbi:MAG: UvrD-helicase domain-containing protein [Bacteroidales bacterium]|nr:UvrD-helicase domain-containing protein [Bacteroidales bacterium]